MRIPLIILRNKLAALAVSLTLVVIVGSLACNRDSGPSALPSEDTSRLDSLSERDTVSDSPTEAVRGGW